MYKISFQGSIKSPNLDLTKALKFIAERIIIPEIAGNIFAGTDIEGNAYPPLDDKTIKAKGGDTRPLIGKERKLVNSTLYKVDEQGKNKVVVSIGSSRSDVARYLQVEGIKSKKYGKRFFNFFGINKKMEKEGINYMKSEINKKIDDAKQSS